MNKSDFDPFLNPNRLTRFLREFVKHDIQAQKIRFCLSWLGFSRGDVFKFVFVTSAAGGVPFPAFVFNLARSAITLPLCLPLRRPHL